MISHLFSISDDKFIVVTKSDSQGSPTGVDPFLHNRVSRRVVYSDSADPPVSTARVDDSWLGIIRYIFWAYQIPYTHKLRHSEHVVVLCWHGYDVPSQLGRWQRSRVERVELVEQCRSYNGDQYCDKKSKGPWAFSFCNSGFCGSG